jgi:hypothetical protein
VSSSGRLTGKSVLLLATKRSDLTENGAVMESADEIYKKNKGTSVTFALNKFSDTESIAYITLLNKITVAISTTVLN